MSRLHRQQATAAALQQLSLQSQPPLPQHPLPPQPHPPQATDSDVDMSGNHQSTSDGSGANGNPGTSTGSNGSPNVDPSLTKPFTRVSLKTKEMVCGQLGEEMITRNGIILQYLNSNSSGSTTMVGVTRIGLKDPRKMPAYVERNLSIIRQHAVAALNRHFKLTLCATGILETLSPEDYSISFSWASISPVARSLTQHGKPDLALGYATCEQFVVPVWATKEDPEPTYVLNVFITLQEPARRSTAVLKKAKEEETARANPPPPKKYNNGTQPFNRGNSSKKSNEELAQMIAQENKVILDACLKRAAPTPLDVAYPSLPAGQGIQWNTSGTTDLPFE